MGAAIDKIKSITNREVLSLVVDVWSTEEEEFRIFYKPSTLAEVAKINKHAKNEAEVLVYTIIFKAMDEQGNKLFGLQDKQYLMREVPSNILADIVLQMGATQDSEEASKN